MARGETKAKKGCRRRRRKGDQEKIKMQIPLEERGGMSPRQQDKTMREGGRDKTMRQGGSCRSKRIRNTRGWGRGRIQKNEDLGI